MYVKQEVGLIAHFSNRQYLPGDTVGWLDPIGVARRRRDTPLGTTRVPPYDQGNLSTNPAGL
jgi:hypothetical protein